MDKASKTLPLGGTGAVGQPSSDSAPPTPALPTPVTVVKQATAALQPGVIVRLKQGVYLILQTHTSGGTAIVYTLLPLALHNAQEKRWTNVASAILQQYPALASALKQLTRVQVGVAQIVFSAQAQELPAISQQAYAHGWALQVLKIVDPHAPSEHYQMLCQRLHIEAEAYRAIAQKTRGHTPELFEEGNQPWHYLVISHLPGRTLWSILQERKRAQRFLPLKVVLTILKQLAEVIDTINQESIINRDIKPDNVMIDGNLDTGENLWVSVFDLGAAVFKQHPGLEDLIDLLSVKPRGITLASGGAVPLTVEFSTPEQLLGLLQLEVKLGTVNATEALESKDYPVGADLYSGIDVFQFGLVAFYLLAHDHAFQTDLLRSARLEAIKQGPKIIARRDLGDQLWKDLGGIEHGYFRKALALDPAKRYPTAQKAYAALEDVFRQDSRRRAQAQKAARSNNGPGATTAPRHTPTLPAMRTPPLPKKRISFGWTLTFGIATLAIVSFLLWKLGSL